MVLEEAPPVKVYALRAKRDKTKRQRRLAAKKDVAAAVREPGHHS